MIEMELRRLRREEEERGCNGRGVTRDENYGHICQKAFFVATISVDPLPAANITGVALDERRVALTRESRRILIIYPPRSRIGGDN